MLARFSISSPTSSPSWLEAQVRVSSFISANHFSNAMVSFVRVISLVLHAAASSWTRKEWEMKERVKEVEKKEERNVG